LIINGVFVFEAIVVLVNVKLFIQTFTHTIGSVIIQFGSIMMFYLFFYYFNTNKIFGLFHMMPVLFSFVNQYYLLFFFMTSYILIEYGLNILDLELQNVIQESLYLEKKEKFERI